MSVWCVLIAHILENTVCYPIMLQLPVKSNPPRLSSLSPPNLSLKTVGQSQSFQKTYDILVVPWTLCNCHETPTLWKVSVTDLLILPKMLVNSSYVRNVRTPSLGPDLDSEHANVWNVRVIVGTVGGGTWDTEGWGAW